MIIFIGILFSVAFTVLVGLLCGNLVFFIDLWSLMIIIFPTVFFLWVTKNGRIFKEYIKSSLTQYHKQSAAELENTAAAARSTMKIVLAAGFFSFIAGLLNVLGNLDNPQYLGPNVAVALISVFYSVSISYFIFFPLQTWAENKAKNINQKN